MPTEAWYREIHERLMAEDPTAPAEFAEAMLEPLIQRLRRKYPHLKGSELLIDAASDALMNYVKRPKQFDPTKRGLFGYLDMSAVGDLRNAEAKQQRRLKKEILLEDVEVDDLGGKEDLEGENLVPEFEHRGMLREIEMLFDDPKDRQLAGLILVGERSTESFVKILGLQSTPVDEQRRTVKRHKDRIKKRLERYGDTKR